MENIFGNQMIYHIIIYIQRESLLIQLPARRRLIRLHLHIVWYHFIAALVGRYRYGTITLNLAKTTPNPIVTEIVKAITSCSVLSSPVKYKITTSKRPQARLPATPHYHFLCLSE